jgi:perosamine synthetase
MTKKRLALEGGTKAVDNSLHKRWPEILPQDRQAVTRVLDRNVLGGLNAPEVTALQEEYSKHIGSKHALALNSGTAALHCALVAAGVEPGDEVLCPVYSFVASPMAIYHVGAVPVFVDIDSRTYNIDPKLVEERITARTKAIMVVHIHGLPADMDELMAIGRKRGLSIIEDYAETHATRYKDKFVGTIGLAGATSLNTSKNLAAGEGGIFITDDDDANTAARRLCCFGEDLIPDEHRKFWSYGIGWNYRTTEIVAAFTREQLKRLSSYNSTAQANAAILNRGLSGIRGLLIPYVPSDRECTYWKYMVQVDVKGLGLENHSLKPYQIRDRILNALRAEGCEPMIWQPHPLAAQPVFRGKPRPWTRAHDLEQKALRSWDSAEYPVCSSVLDRSFSLAHDNFQLYIQSPKLMEQYVEGVDKVFANLDAVLSYPFEDVYWPAHEPA